MPKLIIKQTISIVKTFYQNASSATVTRRKLDSMYKTQNSVANNFDNFWFDYEIWRAWDYAQYAKKKKMLDRYNRIFFIKVEELISNNQYYTDGVPKSLEWNENLFIKF